MGPVPAKTYVGSWAPVELTCDWKAGEHHQLEPPLTREDQDKDKKQKTAWTAKPRTLASIHKEHLPRVDACWERSTGIQACNIAADELFEAMRLAPIEDTRLNEAGERQRILSRAIAMMELLKLQDPTLSLPQRAATPEKTRAAKMTVVAEEGQQLSPDGHKNKSIRLLRSSNEAQADAKPEECVLSVCLLMAALYEQTPFCGNDIKRRIYSDFTTLKRHFREDELMVMHGRTSTIEELFSSLKDMDRAGKLQNLIGVLFEDWEVHKRVDPFILADELHVEVMTLTTEGPIGKFACKLRTLVTLCTLHKRLTSALFLGRFAERKTPLTQMEVMSSKDPMDLIDFTEALARNMPYKHSEGTKLYYAWMYSPEVNASPEEWAKIYGDGHNRLPSLFDGIATADHVVEQSPLGEQDYVLNLPAAMKENFSQNPSQAAVAFPWSDDLLGAFIRKCKAAGITPPTSFEQLPAEQGKEGKHADTGGSSTKDPFSSAPVPLLLPAGQAGSPVSAGSVLPGSASSAAAHSTGSIKKEQDAECTVPVKKLLSSELGSKKEEEAASLNTGAGGGVKSEPQCGAKAIAQAQVQVKMEVDEDVNVKEGAGSGTGEEEVKVEVTVLSAAGAPHAGQGDVVMEESKVEGQGVSDVKGTGKSSSQMEVEQEGGSKAMVECGADGISAGKDSVNADAGAASPTKNIAERGGGEGGQAEEEGSGKRPVTAIPNAETTGKLTLPLGVFLVGMICSGSFTNTQVHLEDLLMMSININIFGAPKVWWWVPRENAQKFKHYAEHMTEGGRGELYTKSISPFLTDREEFPPEQVMPLQKLVELGAKRTIQMPGMGIWTMPGYAFHYTVSMGFNVAESANMFLEVMGWTLEKLWMARPVEQYPEEEDDMVRFMRETGVMSRLGLPDTPPLPANIVHRSLAARIHPVEVISKDRTGFLKRVVAQDQVRYAVYTELDPPLPLPLPPVPPTPNPAPVPTPTIIFKSAGSAPAGLLTTTGGVTKTNGTKPAVPKPPPVPKASPSSKPTPSPKPTPTPSAKPAVKQGPVPLKHVGVSLVGLPGNTMASGQPAVVSAVAPTPTPACLSPGGRAEGVKKVRAPAKPKQPKVPGAGATNGTGPVPPVPGAAAALPGGGGGTGGVAAGPKPKAIKITAQSSPGMVSPPLPPLGQAKAHLHTAGSLPGAPPPVKAAFSVSIHQQGPPVQTVHQATAPVPPVCVQSHGSNGGLAKGMGSLMQPSHSLASAFPPPSLPSVSVAPSQRSSVPTMTYPLSIPQSQPQPLLNKAAGSQAPSPAVGVPVIRGPAMSMGMAALAQMRAHPPTSSAHSYANPHPQSSPLNGYPTQSHTNNNTVSGASTSTQGFTQQQQQQQQQQHGAASSATQSHLAPHALNAGSTQTQTKTHVVPPATSLADILNGAGLRSGTGAQPPTYPYTSTMGSKLGNSGPIPGAGMHFAATSFLAPSRVSPMSNSQQQQLPSYQPQQQQQQQSFQHNQQQQQQQPYQQHQKQQQQPSFQQQQHLQLPYQQQQRQQQQQQQQSSTQPQSSGITHQQFQQQQQQMQVMQQQQHQMRFLANQKQQQQQQPSTQYTPNLYQQQQPMPSLSHLMSGQSLPAPLPVNQVAGCGIGAGHGHGHAQLPPTGMVGQMQAMRPVPGQVPL